MATNKTITSDEQPSGEQPSDAAQPGTAQPVEQQSSDEPQRDDAVPGVGTDSTLSEYEHEGRTVRLTADEAERLGAKAVQPSNKAATPENK